MIQHLNLSCLFNPAIIMFCGEKDLWLWSKHVRSQCMSQALLLSCLVDSAELKKNMCICIYMYIYINILYIWSVDTYYGDFNIKRWQSMVAQNYRNSCPQWDTSRLPHAWWSSGQSGFAPWWQWQFCGVHFSFYPRVNSKHTKNDGTNTKGFR